MTFEIHTCDNCCEETDNEPQCLCDACLNHENRSIDALKQRIAELEAELAQANKERKPSIHKLVELLKECKVEPRFDFEKYPYLYGGSCVPPEEQVGELPYCGDPNCPDCQDKQMEKAGLKWNITERKPPPFCDQGAWLNQNIPRSLGVGWRADPELPPGTIEYWNNGKLIGRIENIGIA